MPGGLAIAATVKVVESLGRETLFYADAGAACRPPIRNRSRATSPSIAAARPPSPMARRSGSPSTRATSSSSRRPGRPSAIPSGTSPPTELSRTTEATRKHHALSANPFGLPHLRTHPRHRLALRRARLRQDAGRRPTSTRSPSSPNAITAGRIIRPRSASSIRTSTSTCCAPRSTPSTAPASTRRSTSPPAGTSSRRASTRAGAW